jgi:hypothetical protein
MKVMPPSVALRISPMISQSCAEEAVRPPLKLAKIACRPDLVGKAKIQTAIDYLNVRNFAPIAGLSQSCKYGKTNWLCWCRRLAQKLIMSGNSN